MVRTEISLFLKNAPGELGKLAALFGQAGINIDAITIQDASSYVKELFKARGKSLKRIASAASYNSMSKDSADFALIRLLPADGLTNQAMDLLSEHDYLFDILPVIAVTLLLRLMDAFKMFDTIYVLTYGGPGLATEVLSLRIYKKGLKYFDITGASAQSWIFLICIFVVSFIIARKFVQVEKRIE